jgi:hypothetical protein
MNQGGAEETECNSVIPSGDHQANLSSVRPQETERNLVIVSYPVDNQTTKHARPAIPSYEAEVIHRNNRTELVQVL